MHPGGVTTQGPGSTEDHILWTKLDAVGVGAVRVRAQPVGAYQGKYYGLFFNGVYEGFNRLAPFNEPLNVVKQLDGGTSNATVYIEDCGDWPAFDDFVPSGQAEENDASTAKRLFFQWTAPYTLTSVRGDSQLSDINIVGAQRGVNVAPGDIGTRARLSYEIFLTDVASTYIVRWWNNNELVAEGSRTGNGIVVCDEINGSGLFVSATLTYTANVTAGVAVVELRWPASYQVHYSTSALTFPRSPEETVTDNGKSIYEKLTPVLAAGLYYWSVLSVDDGGVVQTASIPGPIPLLINTAPSPPTITAVTGGAAALTVTWTVGEAGCTYTAYSSIINEPTNPGTHYYPPPVVTALDATSAVLPVVTGYPGVVRIVVRATKNGVQETGDAVYDVELDAAGAIVAKRPNRANVINVTVSTGLTLSVEGVVNDDDAEIAAAHFDLFVVALASTIDPTGSAQATAALNSAVLGIKRATVPYTVGGAGWYRMALLARGSTGGRSRFYTEYIIYLSGTAPGGVLNLTGKVIRGG